MRDGKTTSDSQTVDTHDYQTDCRTPPGAKTYTCGSLTYTLGGVFTLFAWLLWGDFCFQLMEVIAGPGTKVIPMKLEKLGASNTTMQLILTTLPAILNMTVCSWVGYKSDRHRGKLGRRIPFILYTLPFLTMSLILIALSEDITPYVRDLIPALHAKSPNLVSIFLIGVFGTMFAFFNMFVGSVFYYLANDVVPPQFVGRFVSLFNMIATGASAIFNIFIFRYAEAHFREIIVGAALLYCFGFLIVCFKVKEGKYPPPPEHDDSIKHNRIAGLISFFKQSFSARLYVYIFLSTTFGTMTYAANMFAIFFNRSMNLTDGQFGQVEGYGLLAGFIATYFTAIYIDRWHPIRVAAYTSIFAAATGFANWTWIFIRLPGEVFFWLNMANRIIFAFGLALAMASFLPMCMRIFPKALYGQFCSAQAMVRSFGTMCGGLALGLLMDMLRNYFGWSYYAYHFAFIWTWIWQIAAAVCLYLAYREWQRCGGDESYQPPAPWMPGGFEPVTDKVMAAPRCPRNVMLSLWLGVYGALISLVLSAVFLIFMQRHNLSLAFDWYVYRFLPVKAFLTLICWIQLASIKRDIRNAANGIPTRLGIPHHGVLMINAIQALLYFPVFWIQTIWMIEVDMQDEIIFFGIANLAAMIASTIGLQILRWMERPVASALTNSPAEQATDPPSPPYGRRDAQAVES